VSDKQFKSGQKVRCLDAAACDLSQGAIYTVKYQDDYVRLQGWGNNGYSSYRFELVEPDQLESYNVHCGGPYIARSEYNRQGELLKKTSEALVKVERERDDAKKWFDMTVDEIAQVRASLSHVEGQRDALLKERDSLKGDVEILKMFIEKLKEDLVSQGCRINMDGIPVLKAPSPPAWLRKGWWYAMDKYGGWLTFPSQPSVTNSGWKAGGYSSLPEEYQPDVPVERWREACWQVME
jgi:hypothetical protein